MKKIIMGMAALATMVCMTHTPALAGQCEEFEWEDGVWLQKCDIPERKAPSHPPVCFKMPDWKTKILCDQEIGQAIRPVEKVVEPSNCKHVWVGDRKRGHWDYVCKNPR